MKTSYIRIKTQKKLMLIPFFGFAIIGLISLWNVNKKWDLSNFKASGYMIFYILVYTLPLIPFFYIGEVLDRVDSPHAIINVLISIYTIVFMYSLSFTMSYGMIKAQEKLGITDAPNEKLEDEVEDVDDQS